MSHCVEKLPHSCGTRDGMQVFEQEGKYDAYCFSCNTYVSDPYEGEPPKQKPQRIQKTEEEIASELAQIKALPSRPIPARALEQEPIEYFGIKVAVSETDGTTPSAYFCPFEKDGRVVGYQARLASSKTFWGVGECRGSDLFGWDLAIATGAKRLYITEGPFDAVALYQALRKKAIGTVYEKYHPAVVSLTGGAGSARRHLSEAAPSIRQFKEVVIVFDKDEAGKKATEDALQIIPTAQTVDLPGKDPNDCVINGRSLALCNAVLWKAEVPKNTRLVWIADIADAAKEVPQWGLSWPWEGMTEFTRGIRFGETYYLGAGVKMGKSELVNTLACHLVLEHKMKVLLAKPEEANKKTVKMVYGKAVGKFFHDPTRPFDPDAWDEAKALVDNNIAMLSLYQHLGWDSLRSDIMVAVQQGCKAVFIDPITNLVNGVAAGDTDTKLQEIAQELAAMAKDLDIVVFIFCHLKAPLSGDPHERGGKVLSHQFSGSRAMMRSCNYMLGLEGNKDPDIDDDRRNTRKLVILEDREFGSSGYTRLYWDKNTGLFNEIKEG